MQRPILPYVVLDQNCLRNEQLVPDLLNRARDYGELVVLTDVAVLEMMKNKKWEYTTRRSLRLLAAYPDGVVVSHGIGDLMRMELKSSESHPDIVDHELTVHIRRLLMEIRDGVSVTLDLMKETVPKAQEMARAQQLHHKRNREQIAGIKKAWQSELSAESLNKLRNGDEDHWVELLSDLEMTKTCYVALKGGGYPEETASRLAFESSVSSHAFLGMASVALRWLVDGGADSAKDSTLTNDVLDMDYIVIATFCRRLVSAERAVRTMYARMTAVMDRRCEALWELCQQVDSQCSVDS